MSKRWAALPQGTRWTIGGIAVVLALLIVWALFVPLPDWLAHHDVGSVRGTLHETTVDNARGRLLTLGAGLFAAGALIFTAQNYRVARRTLEVTQQGQVTDRYTSAIGQLGSNELDVRIGGIYALERVARDSERDHPTVMEVLTAFIREHSHQQWPSPVPDNTEPERSTRPDVQAALIVIGHRDPERDIRPVNLARANLTQADLGQRALWKDHRHGIIDRANLERADLTGADFTRANLSGANLTGADLTGAILTGANLIQANLTNANLTNANLTNANLTNANLSSADLTNAHFTGAILTGAILDAANLTYVDLGGANLTAAKLTRANLTRANLGGANLDAANLGSTNLAQARFTGAILTRVILANTDPTEADLTDADLTGAEWPRARPVPPGWQLDTDSDGLKRADTGAAGTSAS
jgi:uncharacterized protein YjbI with pentapeptide repeats